MAATVCTCHVDAQQHQFGAELLCFRVQCGQTWKQQQEDPTSCGVALAIWHSRPVLTESMARGLQLFHAVEVQRDAGVSLWPSVIATLSAEFGYKPAAAKKACSRARAFLDQMHAWAADPH